MIFFNNLSCDFLKMSLNVDDDQPTLFKMVDEVFLDITEVSY